MASNRVRIVIYIFTYIVLSPCRVCLDISSVLALDEVAMANLMNIQICLAMFVAGHCVIFIYLYFCNIS